MLYRTVPFNNHDIFKYTCTIHTKQFSVEVARGEEIHLATPWQSILKLLCLLMSYLKARTHRPNFRGLALESVLESADSSSESADSNADATVGM